MLVKRATGHAELNTRNHEARGHNFVQVESKTRWKVV